MDKSQSFGTAVWTGSSVSFDKARERAEAHIKMLEERRAFYQDAWDKCMAETDWQNAPTQKQAVEMVRDLFYARHPYPSIGPTTEVGTIYAYYDSAVISGISSVENKWNALYP